MLRWIARHRSGWRAVVLFCYHVSDNSIDLVWDQLTFVARLLLFLIFFPRNPVLPQTTAVKPPTWRTALGVAFLCLAHGLLVILISAWFGFSKQHYMGTLANVLGVMSASLACVQYFPQIWTTYQLGHVGSLSIPMMVIQTPGSFVWAASLAVRLGKEGWSIWGVYLVTGCLQGCLLVMGIYFELQARKAGNDFETDVSYITPKTSIGNIVN